MQIIDEAIDWLYWQSMQTVELWQACLLSLEINPDAVAQTHISIVLSKGNSVVERDNLQNEYAKRLKLLEDNLSNTVFSQGINLVRQDNPAKLRVRLSEFAAWIISIGRNIPTELHSIAAPPPESSKTDETHRGARWPDHETTKLTALRMAAVKFWTNYDPNDSTTAETNDKISAWLQKEYQIAKTLADTMASILRPDDLKTGPRKK